MEKKTVVLGAGESGVGAAILAKKQGLDVFVSDNGMMAEKYKRILDNNSIPYEEGGHTEDIILGAGLVIKSPGIPDSALLIRLLCSRGIPVISEIEFAGRYLGNAKVISITGSNGKTTTATLTHKILKDAGYDVVLAGNIGESLAASIAEGAHEWYVLELSSFQLDGMNEFSSQISILMNITPDHLDRYEYNMDKYIDSKLGIIRNQTYDDYFIYCRDDQNIKKGMRGRDLNMRLLPFTLNSKEQSLKSVKHTHNSIQGAYLDRNAIVAEAGEKRVAIETENIKIKGKHNIYNVMASALAALAAGVDEDSIARSVTSFEGVEHRLEHVGVIDGVEYINDSKATNTDSAWYALDGMTKPVIWIAGGTDKGNDYSSLTELAQRKVKTLICMGLDNAKLVDSFTGVIPEIYETGSMEEAVRIARQVAKHDDVVLLSPACASFDLFKNYEHRGKMFKELVSE